LSGCGYRLETRHGSCLSENRSALSGRIQDESLQPIPQSRTPGNPSVVAVNVLLDEVGNVAQGLKVSPRSTWYVRDIAMPPEPTVFAALILKPKLDDERMNCGLC
jgi:hypothetical protein